MLMNPELKIGQVEVIAVDAKGVCRLLPFGVRTWRRLDAAGKCPRAFRVDQKKMWRVEDLRQWARRGFPDRATFEDTRTRKIREPRGGF